MAASSARLPEARGAQPLQENLQQTKIVGHRKKKSQTKEGPHGSHPPTGTSLRKKGKLEITWWKLIDNSGSPFKGAESQSLSQGKMSLLGYTFCINLASVETLTRV